MSYHSAALGESPTLGRRSLYSVLDEQLDEEALGESPTLGEVDRMNEELDLFSPSRITTPCALDDSPTIPISLLPNIKSTTIPRREVPVVSIVDDYMMGKEEWSAKRLGKLPQERYNQLGLFGNINGESCFLPQVSARTSVHFYASARFILKHLDGKDSNRDGEVSTLLFNLSSPNVLARFRSLEDQQHFHSYAQ